MKKLLLILVIIYSCKSTNKTKTVTSTKIDSISHTKVDSTVKKATVKAQVKQSGTVKKTQANKTYEKKTVIEFDRDTVDFNNPLSVTIRPPGGKIFIDTRPRIKSITIFETGSDKSKTTTKTDIKDSTGSSDQHQATVNKTADTELHKVVKAKDKAVKRVNYTGIIIGFCLLILLLIIWKYRKRIPYLNMLFKN